MQELLALRQRTEASMLVAFADLQRFDREMRRFADARVADDIDRYYQLVADRVRAAGGHVVKFFGDGALIVFPESCVDAGALALAELKDAADALMAVFGWQCLMTIKADFGPVIAGPYGASEDRRFDVIGKTVNTAARLESRGLTLSVRAFRALAAETRKHFKKHTPPITYIRIEDPHP